MTTGFTGGCMCGAIRYQCSAEPVYAGICHCRDCQRVTGSAFATALFAPRRAVTITGEVKYHDVTGGSGHVISRGFCPTCGARLFTKLAVLLPDVIGITAGSLDDPSGYRPEMDIFTASVQSWDFMNPELPKFPKMPPL